MKSLFPFLSFFFSLGAALSVCGAVREPLGPSSRRGALIISEIMYHPMDYPDGRNLEFVELYNTGVQPEPLAGWRLSGDIHFDFPPGTVLQPSNYLIAAAAPAALASHFGIASTLVVGPFTNALPNEGGTVRLRNPAGAVVLEVTYDDVAPWPLTADGAGHSLVLARPSFGERDARAWAASALRGGSPGGPEPAYVASAFEDMVLNEIGVATNVYGDAPFVEFFNRGGSGLMLNAASSLFLTDDPTTNKTRLGSAGLPTLGARTSAALPWSSLGLSTPASGGALYLVDTARNRVLDVARYDAQSPRYALGRVPDGAERWQAITPTPALSPPPTNHSSLRPVFRSDVILNEIMYHPLSGLSDDEYVELFNRNPQTTADVSGWKFVAGIDFTLPPNSVIPPGGFLVVARNAQRLRTNYSGLTNVVGNFSGQLSGRGERLALAKPEPITDAPANHLGAASNTVYVVMDEVTYGTGGAWGRWSDGGGASLELASPDGDTDLAGHWRDSAEPANSVWTEIRAAGPAEFGESTSTANAVEVLLMGEGECLVDNVQVLIGGTDRVSNGTLTSANGWVMQGSHDLSSWQATGGVGNSGCLHLRASGHGDTLANRAYVPLTTVVAPGQQITLAAHVRHLRGNLDVLLRIRGNWFDAGATMAVVPGAYGSPGRANAAAANPTVPAIYDVAHSPVLPNANQAVVVTARFDGARTNDGFVRELFYRVDPATSYTTLTMNDTAVGGDSIAGDGVFSATIPGQISGKLVAFRVVARYTNAPATNYFPEPQPVYPGDAFGRECLVRSGEPRPTGSFGTYRIWLTQASASQWTTRGVLHNGGLNATFVYGDQRAIYGAGGWYSGTDAGSFQHYNGPTGTLCGYNVRFPKDEPFLGARELLLDWGQGDDAGQRETMTMWIARELGLPFLHRRHVTLVVNGVSSVDRSFPYFPWSAHVYFDAQDPNGDLVEEWFWDDVDGQLYKLHHLVWGSTETSVSGFHYHRCQDFVNSAGQRHPSAYRWHWRSRGMDRGAVDLGTVWSLLDVLNAPDSAGYESGVVEQVNTSQWMRLFAFERIIGNLDSVGWNNGHNMYAYFSPSQGWHLLPYDCELALAPPVGGWYDASPTKDLFAYDYNDAYFTGDNTLGRMKQTPAFRREYWRAFKDAVDGPLMTTNFLPVMQRYTAALAANGIGVAGPQAMRDYLDARREYIRSQLTTVNASFGVTSPLSGSALNTNLVTFTGTAPVEIVGLTVNGALVPLRWMSVTTWTLSVALPPGAQTVSIQAVNAKGQPIGGASATLNLQINAPAAAPETNVVITEIMYHPAVPGAEFLELRNRSTTIAFDLGGWKVNGLDFTFLPGSVIGPGGFAVIVADRIAFGRAYGFNIPVAGVFRGSFDQGGETITLLRPLGASEVVVDEVTFEDDPPWPAAADGLGSSLQLIDPSLDNNRVAHWFASTNAPSNGQATEIIPMNAVWRYRDNGVDLGSIWSAPGFDDSSWPTGAALLYDEIDPLPATKNTPIAHGATTCYFRAHFGFTGNVATARLNLTTIIDDGAVVYLNGQEAFRLGMPVGPVGYGTFSNRSIGNATNEGPFDLPVTDLRVGDNVIAVEVHQRDSTSSDLVFGLMLDSVAPGNVGGGGLPFTPGAANQVSLTNPALPSLWLNEVQLLNLTGPVDSRGQREPWVELFNGGPDALDLSGFFLSQSPTNLARWTFPPGASIGAGQFRLVWLDGDTADNSMSEWHAGFRLTTNDSALLLSRQLGGRFDVVDYLALPALRADQTLVRVPDGTSTRPRVLDYHTATASNSIAPPLPAIFINEILAANTFWRDPVDGETDDWFELYNASERTVNLAGYTLTDRPGLPPKFVIPDGIAINPRDFLLVWADEESVQTATNGDLHVNFKLNDGGEAVVLLTPDGRLVDSHSFGVQLPNTSIARWPDGLGNFTATTNATPGRRNKLNGYTMPPLTLTLEIVRGVGLKVFFPAGYQVILQCKGRLDEEAWIEVRGPKGYDAATDRAWLLDPTALDPRQRFYRAQLVR